MPIRHHWQSRPIPDFFITRIHAVADRDRDLGERLLRLLDGLQNGISAPGSKGKTGGGGALIPLGPFAAALVERYRYEGRVVEMADWRNGRPGRGRIVQFRRPGHKPRL